MKLEKLAKALQILRTELGKKDIPLHWVEFILLVAAAGERGVTTHDVMKEINMTQGIASRTVKLLSTYLDIDTRKMEGHGIFITLPDHEYRHRQRVVLSSRGKEIINKLQTVLEA